jgi:hypothetical protein
MKRARSTQLLNYSNSTCSGLGLDSGPPFLPGWRPRSNAWTALRRSLSKQLPVDPFRSHPIMPRCEAVFLLPIENTAFQRCRQLL